MEYESIYDYNIPGYILDMVDEYSDLKYTAQEIPETLQDDDVYI